jgi:hypothetical protein
VRAGRLERSASRVRFPSSPPTARRTVDDVTEREPTEADLVGQDPEDVLRRMLAISPEDVAEVREQASEKAAPKER